MREPGVAGLFYPANPIELKETIFQFWKNSPNQTVKGEIRGIFSPHAAYEYSGRIAAEAYRQIQGKQYDNVIAIAPSHYEYFTGCSVFLGNYQTPLGEIPTNFDLAQGLISASPIIQESLQGHRQEHSLELQLPFLQLALENFQLVPLVVGYQNYDVAKELADAVRKILLDSTFQVQKSLIVSSSDLSHYYPLELAQQIDRVVLEDLQNFDDQQLWEDICSERGQACGFAPVISTIQIARGLGANRAQVTAYGTSGEVTHNPTSVVGYGSGVFYETR